MSIPSGGLFFPCWPRHDRDRFAVFCYSDVRRSDGLTATLRRHASQWRDTAELTDERAVQLIREDQIDILVDLTMHMADNRMRLFARKPAPVQATYLAYCSTTGLHDDGLSPHRSAPRSARQERRLLQRKIRPPAGYLLVLSVDDGTSPISWLAPVALARAM